MATTTEAPVRQTYKDYCATPDDERYELINGRLMRVPAPNTKHQRVLGRLYLELARFNQEHEQLHHRGAAVRRRRAGSDVSSGRAAGSVRASPGAGRPCRRPPG